MKMKNLPPEFDLIHETKRRTEYYFFIFLFESIIDQSQNQLKKNNFQCREGRNLNRRVKDNILTLFPHPDCYCCFSCLCIHGIEQDTTLCLLLLLTHKQRHWSLREKGDFQNKSSTESCLTMQFYACASVLPVTITSSRILIFNHQLHDHLHRFTLSSH